HGIAAHWHYKEKSSRRLGGDSKWLQIFKRELPDTRDPEDFLQSIRSDLFSDEVFVYTPKGELIRLPKDATPVDFAYKIHTELGHRCYSAKVNGRMAPLNYNLQTGDVISIQTSNNSRPSAAWLEFVKTSSARNKIRRFLLEDQWDTLLKRGQSTLTRELVRAGFKPREFYNSEKSQEIAQTLGLKNLEELFVNIGFGRISTKQVIARLIQQNKPSEPSKPSKKKIKDEEKESGAEKRSVVRLADIDDIMYRIARCCNPLPGDEIVGFVTRGRGVTIHKANCRNVTNFNGSPERILPLFWAGDQHHPVSVRLEIRAKDRQNLLSDLSLLISSTGTNILNCHS
ncbi:MAG: TGS domain-containing protein, partial [Candidatus Hinthialibacter sp.]